MKCDKILLFASVLMKPDSYFSFSIVFADTVVRKVSSLSKRYQLKSALVLKMRERIAE